MLHRISKTKELPTNKGRVYWFSTEDEAIKQAGTSEAYLWPVKDGFYLFVVVEAG